MIYKVEDFGAKPDGLTLNTRFVQDAINECNKNGGGQVVFSKGEYVLSTVYLKSGVEIKITENAAILGSLNFDDYDEDEQVD